MVVGGLLQEAGPFVQPPRRHVVPLHLEVQPFAVVDRPVRPWPSKLIEAAQVRGRAVNASHLVALVRAGSGDVEDLDPVVDQDQHGDAYELLA